MGQRTAGHTSTGSNLLATTQLFATKSIDKLISDSEEADRRLTKTLGPLSLTALGIGAVIGSGIFTVVGTAIAGQKFDTLFHPERTSPRLPDQAHSVTGDDPGQDQP